MSVVFTLLFVSLAIVLFEGARVLVNLPNTPRWFAAAANSSTCTIMVMTLIVISLMFAAQAPADIDSHAFGLIEGAVILVIAVGTVFALRTLYARRNKARAALAATPAVVINLAEAGAGPADDGPGLGGVPSPTADKRRKNAA